MGLEVIPMNLPHALLCDAPGYPRVVMPSFLSQCVSHQFHELPHPGVCATKALMGKRFKWHGMQCNISHWCRESLVCQSCKVHACLHSSRKDSDSGC